jgi:hypothetical protein
MSILRASKLMKNTKVLQHMSGSILKLRRKRCTRENSSSLRQKENKDKKRGTESTRKGKKNGGKHRNSTGSSRGWKKKSANNKKLNLIKKIRK